MDQMGDHIKINFEYFQIQKWMLQTVRAEKGDETRSTTAVDLIKH